MLFSGSSSFSNMEYPYATNQFYTTKSCSPDQDVYANTKEERSPSSSPASPEATMSHGFPSGPAPPLAHPPSHPPSHPSSHVMTGGYPMPPTGYITNGMTSVYGYPQSYCGGYAASSDSLHGRNEHCMRAAYGWQTESPYH